MTPSLEASDTPPHDARRLLLTGAGGFVGGALYQPLVDAGWLVRCLTRNPDAARSKHPSREWVGGDVEDADSLGRALEGCSHAFYLVHGMGEAGADYRAREVAAARRFATSAAAAGLERIVYLGGLEPRATPSEHLRSRLEVGRVLREGAVRTLELRASMIVGHGSLSWQIIRDLAARLPFMILPRWLKSRTEPVAIDDVVVALARGLTIPIVEGACYDLPGPEVLSAREILEQTAEVMGLRRPLMLELPFLTPWLSSHWVRWVSQADWSVARELVVGLTDDILARNAEYWRLIGHEQRLRFREAARRALQAAESMPPQRGFWPALERARGARRRDARG